MVPYVSEIDNKAVYAFGCGYLVSFSIRSSQDRGVAMCILWQVTAIMLHSRLKTMCVHVTSWWLCLVLLYGVHSVIQPMLMYHYISGDIATYVAVVLSGCCNWKMLCGMLQVVRLCVQWLSLKSYVHMLFVPVQLRLLKIETKRRRWAEYVYVCEAVITEGDGQRDDMVRRHRSPYEYISHHISALNSKF